MKQFFLTILVLTAFSMTTRAEEPKVTDAPEHKRIELLTLDSNGDGAVSRDEFAQNDAVKFVGEFRRYDKNSDGNLTINEMLPTTNSTDKNIDALVSGTIKDQFIKADINKNNFLDLHEYMTLQVSEILNFHFGRLDLDEDGLLTKKELQFADRGLYFLSDMEFLAATVEGGKVFKPFDSDKDGYISQSEYLKNATYVSKSVFEMRDTDKDGKLSQDEFIGANPLMPETNVVQLFKSIDTNQDDFIDAAETDAKSKNDFGEMFTLILDADKDGLVTPEEFKRHPIPARKSVKQKFHID